MNILLRAKPEFKKIVAEQGLPIGTLAEKIGISRMSFHNVLCKKTITSVTAKKICDAFEIPMWDYFEMVEE